MSCTVQVCVSLSVVGEAGEDAVPASGEDGRDGQYTVQVCVC